MHIKLYEMCYVVFSVKFSTDRTQTQSGLGAMDQIVVETERMKNNEILHPTKTMTTELYYKHCAKVLA